MKRVGKTVKKVTEEESLKATIETLEKRNKELENEINELKKANSKSSAEPTVAEIKARLKELGINFNDKANKAELLALLPEEE